MINIFNTAQRLNLLPHIIALSIGAGGLGIALGTEIFLGLVPCELCIYQRIPFLIVAVCGAIGFLSTSFNIKHICIAITALAFLAGSVIAFYHVGAERQWWSSTELCGGKLVHVTETDSLIQALSTRQKPACSNIYWSFLGLSMATYNLFLIRHSAPHFVYFIFFDIFLNRVWV